MAPRTLTRRSYTRPGSSWIYPPALGKRLRDLQATIDALTAAGGVDPEAVEQVAGDLSALRAQLEQVGQQVDDVDTKVTAVDGRVDSVADHTATVADTVTTTASSLRADLTAEAQARVGGDQNTMGVANQARSMARDARDTTTALSTTVADDKAALPATVQDMISTATQQVLTPALAGAEQTHATLQREIDALTSTVAALPSDARAAALEQTVSALTTRLGAEEQARAALAAALVARLSVLDESAAAASARVDTLTSGAATQAARVDAVVAQAAALVAGLAALTSRVAAEEQARASADAALITRVDGLAANQGALSARLDALTTRVDALAARRTYQVGGSAVLPALAINTPKDVDVPWDTALSVVPHSVRIAGADGITTVLTWSVKSVTATKAVVTITSPALLAASVGRLRVVGLYEGTSQ